MRVRTAFGTWLLPITTGTRLEGGSRSMDCMDCR
jgi:hypothetical protein